MRISRTWVNYFHGGFIRALSWTSLCAVLLFLSGCAGNSFKALKTRHGSAYSELWQASRPDFVVYLPSGAKAADSENQALIVVPTPKNSFFAVWTQASRENDPDQRVVISSSSDLGHTWSRPVVLDGEENGNGQSASWGIPVVVPESGRIYVIYNKNVGIQDVRRDTTGELRVKYSDDDGQSWSPSIKLAFRRTEVDTPDEKVPPSWVANMTPVTMKDGSVMIGMTKWQSNFGRRNEALFTKESEGWFLRLDNILTERDPNKLTITTLPEGMKGLRAPSPEQPGTSIAQEPTLVELSDGRYFSLMRTATGKIYYAVSQDKGRTWTAPETLLHDSGEPVLQPTAPAPLYPLADGRYLLVFHNNDGSANGGTSAADYLKNRTPAYCSLGTESLDSRQPISFSAPRVLLENGAIPAGPMGRTEIATYTSFFEFGGRAYFWYPDRKHFLLGKFIDEFVSRR